MDGASRDLGILYKILGVLVKRQIYFLRHLSILFPNHIWNRPRLMNRKNTTASAPPAKQTGSLIIMVPSFISGRQRGRIGYRRKWGNRARTASVVVKADYIEKVLEGGVASSLHRFIEVTGQLPDRF